MTAEEEENNPARSQTRQTPTQRTNMYIYIKIRSKIVICVRKLYNIIYRTATNLHNKRYKYATLTTITTEFFFLSCLRISIEYALYGGIFSWACIRKERKEKRNM